MSWSQSLIRISNFEVETLQKRLGEIVERRSRAEIRLALLAAEVEGETARARADAEAGWYHAGFIQGAKIRAEKIEAEIEATNAEEDGARDALAEAFEALKKFEHVAEQARLTEVKEEGRRETIAMNEMGLRRATR